MRFDADLDKFFALCVDFFVADCKHNNGSFSGIDYA